MSNRIRRPELRGVIVVADCVVGGVELPVRADEFIEQFNREYRRLGLTVQSVVPPDALPPVPLLPATATAA